jgi:hypothetical protein
VDELDPGAAPGLTRFIARILTGVICLYAVAILALMFYWDQEPELFDVQAFAQQQAGTAPDLVIGDVTTGAIIHVMQTLLDKRGGYLGNDIAPPGVLMDNIPRWEFGVITQVRDIVGALRNDFSRSQSQSTEDDDLVIAAPQLSYDTESWLLPSSESEYRTGIKALQRYLTRLSNTDDSDAQFYARADNLAAWLAVVEKRLGSLSQRLSASVGQMRINTDLQGDAAATQSTAKADMVLVQTPWTEVDDVFYEARGSAWALIHFLRAVERDFSSVLEKKNALVSLRQIIRELEATQGQVWSPVILNGPDFGLMSNHSLVMASYISRANAAVIDLRNLLSQG